MPIKDYSTTASDNTSLFPEGMNPSSVNNSARQVQADIRSWYENPEYRDFGDIPTYHSANSFTMSGDKTGVYIVGRRVRMHGSVMGTFYGTISNSSFSSPNTTIVVLLDDGSLTSNISSVSLGVRPDNPSIPSSAISGGFSSETISYNSSGSGIDAEDVQAAIDELSKPFFSKAIGEVFFCSDNLMGAEIPNNTGTRKYIRLTAGQDGVGEFNDGLLTDEATEGSGATLVVTAEIAVGPMAGGVVHLINSMDAVIKASVTSDVFEQDAFQGHWHTTWGTQIDVIGGSQPVARGTSNAINQDGAGYSAARAPKSDGVNGTPRVADRTRVKSVSKVAYMRVV